MSLVILCSMALMGLMAYGLVGSLDFGAKDVFGLAGIIIGVIAIAVLAVIVRQKENQLAKLSEEDIMQAGEADLWIVLKILAVPEGHIIWLARGLSDEVVSLTGPYESLKPGDIVCLRGNDLWRVGALDDKVERLAPLPKSADLLLNESDAP